DPRPPAGDAGTGSVGDGDLAPPRDPCRGRRRGLAWPHRRYDRPARGAGRVVRPELPDRNDARTFRLHTVVVLPDNRVRPRLRGARGKPEIAAAADDLTRAAAGRVHHAHDAVVPA